MNKLQFGVAIAALAIPAAASAQRGSTPAAVIVVVDNSRVFSECNACRAATTQLQTLVQNAQAQARALEQPLQTEANSIQQTMQTTSTQPVGAARTAAEAALRQRAQAFDARKNQADQQVQQIEANLQSTQRNVQRQINEKLGPIYQQVMTAHGANMAVDTDATLAHANGLDVTNEVLASLNATLPAVSVTPLPAAANPNPTQGR